MSIYRKIYKQHYGPIPLDEEGRTYEIHHIDGNHKNNNPSNLKAVTIQEHYDIHYNNKDYGACQAIAIRMAKSHKEISKLASLATNKRIEEGTFIGFTSEQASKSNTKRMADGSHPFANRKMVPIISKIQQERIKNGTHEFLNKEFHQKHQAKLIRDGKHNTLLIHTCPHCGKIGKGPPMFRHHFDKCKKLRGPVDK